MKKYFSAVAKFIATVAAAIVIWEAGKSVYHERHGEINKELRVTHLRLSPSPASFTYPENDFEDVVWVKVSIHNYGDTVVHLTSMNIEGIGPLTLKGGTLSGLLPDPAKSKPVKVDPQESTEITAPFGLHTKGITNFICDKLGDTVYATTGEHYWIPEVYKVEWINDWFAERYGDNAAIKLQFFSGFKKLVGEHVAYLSHGKDQFDHGGRFQHDYFIATALAQMREEQELAPKARLAVPVGEEGEGEPLVDIDAYRNEYRSCLSIREHKL